MQEINVVMEFPVLKSKSSRNKQYSAKIDFRKSGISFK
jgi:hypothetical protein